MANELTYDHENGTDRLYVLVRDTQDLVWWKQRRLFTSYNKKLRGEYALPLVPSFEGSHHYIGDFPIKILRGLYRIIYYKQIGEAPSEKDEVLWRRPDFHWDGEKECLLYVPSLDFVNVGALNGDREAAQKLSIFFNHFHLGRVKDGNLGKAGFNTTLKISRKDFWGNTALVFYGGRLRGLGRLVLNSFQEKGRVTFQKSFPESPRKEDPFFLIGVG